MIIPQFTKEEYLAMDPVEFRARFRERLHHTLEIQTYAAIHQGRTLPEHQTDIVNNLMEMWDAKGLSKDEPDYVWGKKLVGFAETLQSGGKVDLSEYAPYKLTEENFKAFEHVMFERRSVRHWTDEEVPDWMIDKIMEAGRWAAHSCNLQSIRFAVVREKNEPGLFRGSDIPGGPVHIVVLQDEKVYRANPRNPVRNRLIDVGAATQNMILMTHALGLCACWLTFEDPMIERIGKRLELPEEVKMVTYIDVGFPAQTPSAPGRLELKETVLRRL